MATVIDAPPSLSDGLGSGIRWGSEKLRGAREEVEDDAVIVSSSPHNKLDGFFCAAVFYGHAGFSSVKFLKFVMHVRCLCLCLGKFYLS